MAMIRLRLLPVTILVIGALLIDKTATLVSTAAAGTPDSSDSTATGMAPPPTSATAAAMPSRMVPNWDSTQPPPAVCPPDASINQSEVSVLSALRKRSTALDDREAELDRKQALVDASEQSLSTRLAGLQAVEDRLNALSENQTQAADNRWQGLVTTYEAMDPQAAAGIFNGLGMDVLLPVLTRMSSRKAAVVLADMAPDKARQATELMAGQTPDLTLGNATPAVAAP